MNQRMILGVMAGVALWGAVLAVGAYRWQGGNVWRGVIVAVCVAVFLQFWLIALIARARSLARRNAALKGAAANDAGPAKDESKATNPQAPEPAGDAQKPTLPRAPQV